MKKIIAILHYARGYGGSTLSLVDMVKMLRPEFDVTVYVSCKASPKVKKALDEIDVRTVVYSKQPKLFAHFSGIVAYKTPGFWYGLVRSYNDKYWINELRNKYDIVILNSSILAPLGAILVKNGIKTVCFNRETHSMIGKGWFDNKMRSLLNKQSSVFFLSDVEKCHYSLQIPSYSFPDVLNTDLMSFPEDQNEAKKKLGLQKSDFCLLFMGGISEIKGTSCILESMSLLKNSSIKLLVLGDPNAYKSQAYYDKCNNLIHVSENIIFYGVRKDIGLFYSACDILVFPSAKAHQARPVYEAGYYKKTAIISDFEETKEFAIDNYNVLTFPPNNALKLAEKVEELYDNRDLMRQLAENNADMTLKKHSIEFVGENMRTVLNSIGI